MISLEEKLAELTARFDARASEERRALNSALKRDDRKMVATCAHKIAGIAGMIGRSEIGAAAFELEGLAESGGDMELAAKCLDGLLAALEASS